LGLPKALHLELVNTIAGVLQQRAGWLTSSDSRVSPSGTLAVGAKRTGTTTVRNQYVLCRPGHAFSMKMKLCKDLRIFHAPVRPE